MLADTSPVSTATATTSRGRWVVLGLLGLGLFSTAIIWTYWKVRMTPFVPLRTSLGAAFRKSTPRAEAATARNGARLLMLSLDVPEPPRPDDPQTRADLVRIIDITRAELDLRPYDVLEIYLTRRIPEHAPKRLKASFLIGDALKASAGTLPKGQIIDPDARE